MNYLDYLVSDMDRKYYPGAVRMPIWNPDNYEQMHPTIELMCKWLITRDLATTIRCYKFEVGNRWLNDCVTIWEAEVLRFQNTEDAVAFKLAFGL